MVKNFILDTNIILSSGSGGGSKVLSGFTGGKDKNSVWILGSVLQELDAHKNDSGEVGFNARDFIRELDQLRTLGDLTKGVDLQHGKVYVEPDGVLQANLPAGFSIDRPDNKIISSCIHIANNNKRRNFVFVTNDVSCRCNADICFRNAKVTNITIESYKNDQIISDEDEEYKGYIVIEDEDPDIVQALYEDVERKGVPYKNPDIVENEYVYLPESKIIAVYENGKLIQIHEPSVFGLNRLYNPQQIMAMHALLAPASEVSIIVLTGAPGTGKTFLPVAAAVDQIYHQKDKKYDRMVITRSNSLSKDEDLGFLPGDIDDKMDPLIQPVYDSLESLLRIKNNGNSETKENIDQQIDDIFDCCFDIIPMLYIRGRNFTNKIALLDEAQNANPRQIKDFLTRGGVGSKLILAGSESQVDNPKLDRYTNGLTYAVNKLKGKGVAIISFGEKEIVRGEAAKIATERLK